MSDLLGKFRFVPTWRVDDVMVSYAPEGGSVGPHVDNYDVFLLQVTVTLDSIWFGVCLNGGGEGVFGSAGGVSLVFSAYMEPRNSDQKQ